MATGFLKVIVVESESKPIENARVLVNREGMSTIEENTDRNGMTQVISLETADKELSLQENATQLPFFIYQLIVKKPGYLDAIRTNVTIFDGQTSILYVNLIPLDQNVSSPVSTPKTFSSKIIFSDIS